MAVKSATPAASAATTSLPAPGKYVQPIPVPPKMDWTFPEGVTAPEGSDRKFGHKSGTLRGKTYLDVSLENPEHFFSIEENDKLPKSLAEYVEWVRKHFEVDTMSKKLTQRAAGVQSTGSTSSASKHQSCVDFKVHHKGSSARFIRTHCAVAER